MREIEQEHVYELLKLRLGILSSLAGGSVSYNSKAVSMPEKCYDQLYEILLPYAPRKGSVDTGNLPSADELRSIAAMLREENQKLKQSDAKDNNGTS